MPRFCANLSLLFTEHPFAERWDAAARAGFRGVECHFPYAEPAEVLADALRRNAQEQVLFNLPAGDWPAGERGIGCLPDRIDEFEHGVGTAIRCGRKGTGEGPPV